MVKKIVRIMNKEGIHMRPAGILAREMKQFPDCQIFLMVQGKKINACSAMQVMAAGMKYDTEIEICADGLNESEALERAASLFADGFGE